MASEAVDSNRSVIIGAGPAGLAAAMQLRRYGLQPLVFECAKAGGLLWNANLVENYPGFPAGISGPALVKLFQRQAERLGVEIICEAVIQLSWEGERFRVTSSNGLYFARQVILAMGTQARPFTDLNIPPALHERVLYEVEPILHVAGKRVVIVGAGDAAFDYALNLGKKNQVVILNRGEQRKCLPLLWERANLLPNIRYNSSTRLLEVSGAPAGEMLLKCDGPDGSLTLPADYLLGALGRAPRRDCLPAPLLKQAGDLERRGRLYFAGDLKNGLFRQTAIAVGDGLLAAMQIYQGLSH